MTSNSVSSMSLQIVDQQKLILSKVPLYATIAASPECVIYYENKVLSTYDRDPLSKKAVPWANNDGHVIDICWYKDKQFIILTQRRFYLFNADMNKIDSVHKLADDDKEHNYHRCTSSGECIMLCFSGWKTTIEEWTLKECKKRWLSPITCAEDESICCLCLSSNTLGLTISKRKQGSRFEVRNHETMSVLFSIRLAQACYRFTSMNEHNWLLVPYYSESQVLLLVDTNEKIIKKIDISLRRMPPTSNHVYDGCSDEMIWNVALMLGQNRCLVVRRERTVCVYSMK
ncbi:unnamed protein product [Rotaria magnacalcarata]|uniref:Uncharacterized protein n=5 Tax=Rotaria magnacalcarata TaxID=392030 RepID=A0A816TIQ9_9BILA|nr:unnamed protein product [Rotaria magnacalcarata]